MSYRFVDNFQAGPEELSETCEVPCQNKFVKLVHLVRFIIKKFVMMHSYRSGEEKKRKKKRKKEGKKTVFNLCQIFKRFISHHYVVIFDIYSVDEMNTA